MPVRATHIALIAATLFVGFIRIADDNATSAVLWLFAGIASTVFFLLSRSRKTDDSDTAEMPPSSPPEFRRVGPPIYRRKAPPEIL